MLRRIVGTGWHRPRYRGTYLLAWGIIHLAFAVALLRAPLRTAEVTAMLLLGVTPHVWALWAALGGVVSIATAFRVDASTAPAFVLLATMIVGRGLAHVGVAIVYAQPAELASAVIWFTLASLHLTVARWPNPRPASLDPVVLSEAIAVAVRDTLRLLDDDVGDET